MSLYSFQAFSSSCTSQCWSSFLIPSILPQALFIKPSPANTTKPLMISSHTFIFKIHIDSMSTENLIASPSHLALSSLSLLINGTHFRQLFFSLFTIYNHSKQIVSSPLPIGCKHCFLNDSLSYSFTPSYFLIIFSYLFVRSFTQFNICTSNYYFTYLLIPYSSILFLLFSFFCHRSSMDALGPYPTSICNKVCINLAKVEKG